ncbi:prolipoprotein diacylglyceryl transferase [Mycolicibacterium doricum]|uniref:Phosphatidylglycerol--prolipoprotein diacylglyceryl transferase n=1 Tax=Mycolicibacterium doricum TaxID=126673 RepID=A0A1X1TK30_9MYCO|nr:prolipoprotein diacylglyceryl transferase [Mycolicibacterium doricum]MCV7268526.1 prolipoprotein diacylglyceryl transferase [Mycolicibacterium doricum]ORV44941.1 hypothetical protein AWC01_02545 [Mycolicibacterium doricum]BBZ08063.1 prolipoprotein diacylglyceryl transferase [Mycolicibacterium doricum]
MTNTLAYIPSPPQGVWELGPFPLRAYAVCIIAGIIVALVLGDRRWEARGGERGVIYDIALWAVPFGLIGGRLYHVLTDWQTYFGPGGAGLIAAFRIWEGGLGIWGAVALGGVGAWIACRRRDIPLPAFGDAIAPGIILAQAIGRLGNYFNQELYGRATTVPWGLEIYERVDASGARNDLTGVSTGRVVEVVHPTFLYELVWNLLVFAVLIWADRRFNLGHGRLFALYVAGYCLGRFWIELLRSDAATELAGIRVNSFTSMFVFIGAVVYLMVAPRGREDPATLRTEPAEDAGEAEPGERAAEDVEPEDAETEDSATRELVNHLVAGVAVTSGLGIAANAAADEDEKGAEAAEGEEADDKAEPVAEAEALAEDVESASSHDIAEAVAFAEAGEAPDREPLTTAGAVEGEDAVAAEESAQEAHEAAVEGAEEAEAVADEVAAEPGDAAVPVDESETSAEDVESASSEDTAEAGEAADSEPVTTAGAVDDEDAVGPEEDLEAAVKRADEAEAVAEGTAADTADTADTAEEEVLDGSDSPGEDITDTGEAGDITDTGDEPAEPGEDVATDTSAYQIITTPEARETRRRWWRRRK